jgi:hypothetical protein
MAMYDLSGSGTKIALIASKTFPAGFTISAFGKDADPFDVPEVEIASAEMDLNGNFYSWTLQNPITVSVNVSQGTEESLNLGMVYSRNRAGANRAKDKITLVKTFPDGSTQSYTGGIITNGSPGKPVNTDGKMTSKSYTFMFSDYVETPPLS